MRLLIVVDMQKDFVDAALGTSEAQAIVPAVCEKIQKFDGAIIVTQDTHQANYLDTQEGRILPVPHCIQNTPRLGAGQQGVCRRQEPGRRRHPLRDETYVWFGRTG